jgi:protein-arginine kinase activator protein McsA
MLKKKKINSYYVCKACGWVHFGISRKFAQAEVKKFNEYFAKLDAQKQQDYYGGVASKVEDYEKCQKCGTSYKLFEQAADAIVPRGSTIGPIIV